MPYSHIFVLLLSALAGVGSQLLFKYSLTLTNQAPAGKAYIYFFFTLLTKPTFLVALMLYGFSFMLWIFLLSRTSLSLVYPIGIAFNVMLALVFASLLLNESLHIFQIAGVLLIIIGVCIVLF